MWSRVFVLFLGAFGLLRLSAHVPSLLPPQALAPSPALTHTLHAQWLPQMKERELGAAWLGNDTRQLKPLFKGRLKNLGVIHLLALSGAQTTPLLHVLVGLLGALVTRLPLARTWALNHPRPHRRVVRHFLPVVMAVPLVLYGATGALTRALFAPLLAGVRPAALFCKLSSPAPLSWPVPPLLSLGAGLLLAAGCTGASGSNLSFLLSFMGAQGAALIGPIPRWLLGKASPSYVWEPLSWGLCTILMGALLQSPYTPRSLFESLLANLVLVPLVSFAITPLALWLGFGALWGILPWQGLALKLLDASLSLFHLLADRLPCSDLRPSLPSPLALQVMAAALFACRNRGSGVVISNLNTQKTPFR